MVAFIWVNTCDTCRMNKWVHVEMDFQPELKCLGAWVSVPRVDSASKNEYQDIPGGKCGRCVGVTTLQPSCDECHEIWEP